MTTIEQQIQAHLQAGARAVVVAPDWPSGALIATPVATRKSIVDLETELTDHLDAAPYSDALLAKLRDYCAARLEARARASATPGGLALATGCGWTIVDIRPLRPAVDDLQSVED